MTCPNCSQEFSGSNCPNCGSRNETLSGPRRKNAVASLVAAIPGVLIFAVIGGCNLTMIGGTVFAAVKFGWWGLVGTIAIDLMVYAIVYRLTIYGLGPGGLWRKRGGPSRRKIGGSDDDVH